MKKLTRILAVSAFIGSTIAATGTMALDSNVDATVDFLPAITLTVNQVVDFGTVEFTGVPTGAITLATDDTVGYGAGLTGDTVGIAGEIEISAGTGATVDVSCDDTGAQVGFGANTLTLQAAEIVMGTGNGVAALAGTDCTGLGAGPIAHVMAGVAADDTILMGAEIDANTGTVATGTYTSTISGNFMQVRALYQ
jgi:hypothetical protein